MVNNPQFNHNDKVIKLKILNIKDKTKTDFQ